MGLSDISSDTLTSMSARKETDFAALLAVLARYPEGASLDQIARAAALDVSRRTLIRRLAELVAAQRLRKHGNIRSARYSLPMAPDATPDGHAPPKIELQHNIFAPLSDESAAILRNVSRPEAARTPVGYHRAFLDSYSPEDSSYLTPADRARLHKISRTAEGTDEPAGTHAQRILDRLLIDLSWNSSRLEGNTYSLLDTRRLIEGGEVAEGKDAADAQMILNHKAAIEFLVQSADEIGFNHHTLLNLHAILAENLLIDPGAAGRIRRIPVEIGRSVYHPPGSPQLLEECFGLVLDKATAISDPFEQAFFVMVQLPYLQPFEDVNKRTSRLAANIPLIKQNLSPLSFIDVDHEAYITGMLGIYELNRVDLFKDVFLWAYERSAARYAATQQMLGEPDQLRLRYRQQLKQVVASIIREPMDTKMAARYIAEWASQHIPAPDRSRFVELVETELLGLHAGNFARHQIRPSEFAAWRRLWEMST